MNIPHRLFSILFMLGVILALAASPAYVRSSAVSAQPAFAGPPAPVLLLPANGAFTNNANLQFTWNASAGGDTYQIQIATTSSFGISILQDHTGGSGVLTYTVNPAFLTDGSQDGKYYWHVRAINLSLLAGPWSAARSFTFDSQKPAIPVLVSPLDTVSVIGTPTFKWLSVVGAKAYQLEYADDSGFTTNVYDSGPITKTSLMPPTMTVGTHYWHAQARDAAGNWSDWSDFGGSPWSVVVVPPIPAKPVLISPLTKNQTDDLTPTLTWGAVPYGATYEIQIDDLSTFASPNYAPTGIVAATYTPGSDLATGKWYWRVRAVNSLAQAGQWSSSRYFSVYASFDSEFDVNRSGWTDQAGAAWSQGSGNLSTPGVNAVGPYTCFGVYTCYDTYTSSVSNDWPLFGDMTFVARMKMDFGSTPDNWINEYGLVVHGTPTPSGTYNDWDSGYYFQLGNLHDPTYGNLGLYDVGKYVGGNWTSLTNGRWWYSSHVNFNDWNDVKVVAVGHSLKFYVNGWLIFSKSDTSLPVGMLGIQTWRVGAGTTYVDYAKIGGPQDASILSAPSMEQVEVPTLGFLEDPNAPWGPGKLTPVPAFLAAGFRQ